MTRVTKIALVVSASLFSMGANAQVTDIDWSGFASFKAGSTLESDQEAYGYENDIDFKNESLFAIQARSDVSENVSVTAQVMGRGKDDFDLSLEWAYMTYNFTGNTSINVGRLRTAFFQYSDFLDVGYVYDWVRVPQSVYSLGYTSLDGVGVNHRFNHGNWDFEGRLMYGTHDSSTSVDGTETSQSVESMYGGSLSARNGNLEMRIARFEGDLSFTNDDLVQLGNGLIATGLPELGSNFLIQDNDAEFSGFGLFYDNGSHVFNSEITRAETKESIIPVMDNYYLSYGYRFGSMTPYVMYENRDNQPHTDFLTDEMVSNPLLPTAEAVIRGIGEKSETWSVGLRKNLSNSLAFKTQFSNIDNEYDNETHNLISVSFDMIF